LAAQEERGAATGADRSGLAGAGVAMLRCELDIAVAVCG